MKNSLTLRLSVTIALALGVQFAAQAASHAARHNDSIDARYRSERAACLSGQSNEDRTTCLKEAGAARAEARSHRLDNVDNGSSQLQQNAHARCIALPAADRSDCEKRMSGEGSVSGSVNSGGLMRELKTEMPGK